MIDCSITTNYLKEKSRMTDSCRILCKTCPLNSTRACFTFEVDSSEEAIAIVQKWSDEHPIKTYKDDFFEKFPLAHKSESGNPIACRNNLYANMDGCTGKSCFDCWNEVMPEGNESDRDMKEESQNDS